MDDNEGVVFEHELVSEHFEFFVSACKNWIKFLGLTDWCLTYRFLDEDSEDARAATLMEHRGNRVASIFLYNNWDIVPTDFALWRTAFHEVLELMLFDLHILAQRRDWDYEKYDREHHRVIRILENSFMRDMWDNGHEIFNFQSSTEGRGISRPKVFGVDSNLVVYDTGVPDSDGE